MNDLNLNFDNLSLMGEFGLIENISKIFSEPVSRTSSELGIGDDCAIIPIDQNRTLLVTTDILIENEHFKRDWIKPADLGYKSLAVNLSDISALGGQPAFAFLSIGIPPDLSPEWLESFFLSTNETCKSHNIKLMGGDTSKSSDLIIINYTILGWCKPSDIILRSGALPGNIIALIGKPGESGAGLKLLQSGHDLNESHKSLVKSHHRPDIYMNEATYLGASGAVTSMIDLSDGICSDARHIAKRSKVSLQIDINNIPVSSDLKQVSEAQSWNLEELLLMSGEDYGLLFTIKEDKAEKIIQEIKEQFNTEITIIGEVKEGNSGVNFIKDGLPWISETSGFDHFKSS